MNMNLRPIFVGGTGRSGTTILKRVLSCHSRVVSLPIELRVIVDPEGALDLISILSSNWSPYKADLAIHRFMEMLRACGRSSWPLAVYLEKIEKHLCLRVGVAPRRYLGMGLGSCFGYTFYHRRVNQLLHDISFAVSRGGWIGSPFQLCGRIFETEPVSRQALEKIMGGFFDDLYTNAANGGETHWLDDTPYNLLHADELLSLFPNMRFVHVYRDPRDVLASHKQFSWGGNSYEITVRRLAGIYRRWFEIRNRLPNGCFLEIGLEQLANDPASCLNYVCEFFGIEFEERLMEIRLDKVHAGRWEKEIPKASNALIQKHLGEYIASYGY